MYYANKKCKKRIWTAPAVKGLSLFDIIFRTSLVVEATLIQNLRAFAACVWTEPESLHVRVNWHHIRTEIESHSTACDYYSSDVISAFEVNGVISLAF